MMTSLKIADLQQVAREEGFSLGREEGISLGREEGISLGREEGISLGREEGAYQNKLETARALLAEGLAVAMVARCTGLPLETIQELMQN